MIQLIRAPPPVPILHPKLQKYCSIQAWVLKKILEPVNSWFLYIEPIVHLDVKKILLFYLRKLNRGKRNKREKRET